MQILVVAAIIQMRTLKTEVEKGSVITAIGHGSVVLRQGQKPQESQKDVQFSSLCCTFPVDCQMRNRSIVLYRNVGK